MQLDYQPDTSKHILWIKSSSYHPQHCLNRSNAWCDDNVMSMFYLQVFLPLKLNRRSTLYFYIFKMLFVGIPRFDEEPVMLNSGQDLMKNQLYGHWFYGDYVMQS